jgi:hypothetical protein
MPRQTFYNPDNAPNPTEWLALPEQERIRVAFMFHMARRLKSGNAKAHAAIHVIIENQIAMGFGPTVRAMTRLQTQGLSRHDSLHAIGSVVSSHIYEATRQHVETDSHTVQAAMNAAIERLDVESWRREYGG